METLKKLADPRRPSAGKCAVCGAEAATWHRTGKAAGGLRRAALACPEHESAVVAALDALTLEQCVAFVRPARRAATAEAAVRHAEKLEERAWNHLRTSARLAGASSHTHLFSLLSGAAETEARVLREFAAALLREEVAA